MSPVEDFRLIHVADLHLGAGQMHHLDNWRKVVAWTQREHPDLVVVNGDLVMDDPDREDDHAFARAEIDRLGIRCRFLPGNHDIGDNIVSGKMPQRVNAERVARFRRHYGEDRWAFAAAGWHFIGVNSQLFGSGGLLLEEDQWRWLESTLDDARGSRIALFTHKPLFLDHPGEADSEDASMRQSCLDSASRTRLLALIQRHGVRMVASGHKHQTRSFFLDGIYYLWSPSTACVNGAPTALHWGTREVGFIDYRFSPGGFTHQVVGADFLFRHETYVRKLHAGN